MQNYKLLNPEVFHITDENGNMYYGADQIWYPTYWQRQSGCGPTSCSHLMWYLARTKQKCQSLAPYDGNKKNTFLKVMEDVWQYVTPGRMGVNRASIFTEGAKKYGADRNIQITSQVLDIPVKPFARPDIQTLVGFLNGAFTANLPVAFLNLSNGKIPHLDTWHWVTLIGFDPVKRYAVMYDQGECHEIDLGIWLSATALGGAFVILDAKSNF